MPFTECVGTILYYGHCNQGEFDYSVVNRHGWPLPKRGVRLICWIKLYITILFWVNFLIKLSR
jgi:hypothetical protein